VLHAPQTAQLVIQRLVFPVQVDPTYQDLDVYLVLHRALLVMDLVHHVNLVSVAILSIRLLALHVFQDAKLVLQIGCAANVPQAITWTLVLVRLVQEIVLAVQQAQLALVVRMNFFLETDNA
jgi:hypothetical protein